MDIALYCRNLAHKVRVWRSAADGESIPYVRPIADNVREYALAAKIRPAIGAVSAPIPLPPLGLTREIYVYASTKCYFRSGLADVAVSAATGHDLDAGERWHLRVPEGHTHIAVIRDSADGFLSIVPVA